APPPNNAPAGGARVFALEPASGKIVWEAKPFEGQIFAPVSPCAGSCSPVRPSGCPQPRAWTVLSLTEPPDPRATPRLPLAARARYPRCGVHEGGSLAGNDSSEASCTMSDGVRPAAARP